MSEIDVLSFHKFGMDTVCTEEHETFGHIS